MKKPVVVNVKIPAGQAFGDGSVILPKGDLSRCALFTDSKPSSMVFVKIKDASGNEVHPSVCYKEYQPTNGNHYESRKPLEAESEVSELFVEATSKAALMEDFEFQMIFYTE